MAQRRERSSLGLELIELSHVLDAICIAADAERAAGSSSPAEARRSARALSATVTLVVQRLRALGAALADEPGRKGS